MAEEKKDSWHFGKNLTPNEDGSWYLGKNLDKFGQRITGREEPRRYSFSDFASLIPGNRIASYMYDVLRNDPNDPDDYYLGKVMDRMIEKNRTESKGQEQARVQHESRHSGFKQSGAERAEEEFQALQDTASRKGAATGGEMKREEYGLGGLVSKLVRKLFTKHKGDAAIESDLSYLSSKIKDVDNEISSFTKQEVNNSSSIRESVNELERNKDDLVSGLKQIEEEGIPLNYDEEGFPITKKAEGENYPKDMFGNRLSNKDLDEIERMIAEGEMYPDEGEAILKRAGRTKKAEGGELDDQMNALAISVEPARVEEMPTEMEKQKMLPDEEMEEDYVDYVVNSTLEEQDKNYLESALAEDAKLSEIFDQVIESATEFSGSGPIEGPGSEMSDSIPARLSDGEFVFTAKAAEEIGVDNLQQMMEDAETMADERQPVAYGGMINEEDEAVPLSTQGSRAALGQIPNVVKQSRQVEEEMLKSSPRRYYVPVSG